MAGLRVRLPAAGGAAVAVQPASAQVAHETAVSTAAPSASISDVEVARAGQQTTVRISGTGDLRYQTSRLDSPPRLVLDFANTRAGGFAAEQCRASTPQCVAFAWGNRIPGNRVS